MKTLILTFLALVWVEPSAFAASPDFRVELFSNHSVKSLTLEAAEQSVTLCGAKLDGPCLVLSPSKRIVCSADGEIHCRLVTTDRSFAFLSADSSAPFRVTPAFPNLNNPPQTCLMQHAHINLVNGSLKVITQVDLESYVSGVLRGEASVLRSPAARQAMAILARTWALRWQGRHGAGGFDFCSLTHCQVFRPAQVGEATRHNGIDPAVLATQGQTLKYHGKLADPYFTASCGGITEAAGNVWPDRAQPYLISVHDLYCLGSSHASWKQSLTSESLQTVLLDSLQLPISVPLTDLFVEKRDSSGRATGLRVVAGGAWSIDANGFRYAVDRRLGWEQIKSNLYSIERRGDAWVFSGHGLGHGVGLCQAGAEQMARMGSSTEHILSTYFPGTEIGGSAPLDADPVASSEHFELIYYSSQEPWVKRTLDALEKWRRELGVHAESLPQRVRVQTWTSVADFTRSTGEPGWMAAASDGQSIALQPLELLGRKRILDQTVRHELTHLVVHRLAAKDVPRWFEEGAVLYLTGERIETKPSAFKTGQELEVAIIKPHSEAEMKSAYAQALERVRHYARQQGDNALWRALQHPDAQDERFMRSML